MLTILSVLRGAARAEQEAAAVARENQGIRMSYILMIMHERVAGITNVEQIDSALFRAHFVSALFAGL